MEGLKITLLIARLPSVKSFELINSSTTPVGWDKSSILNEASSPFSSDRLSIGIILKSAALTSWTVKVTVSPVILEKQLSKIILY